MPEEKTHTNTSPSRQRRWIFLGALLVLIIAGLLIFTLSRRPVSSIPRTLEAGMTYEVLNIYPHDSDAFTQGLIFLDGYLYESTGLYGRSSLRKVDLATGEVLRQIDLTEQYFAEGLTFWDDALIQLTWREGVSFRYALETFEVTSQHQYVTEGWGLTHDGQHLIMSDGSATLFFRDPKSFEILREITITDQGSPIPQINELEFVLGEVFANIWQTDLIARIDPETGQVLGWIDLENLLPAAARTVETDVLNGIAYDPKNDRLFVTGKLWPYLYEIALVPITDGP